MLPGSLTAVPRAGPVMGSGAGSSPTQLHRKNNTLDNAPSQPGQAQGKPRLPSLLTFSSPAAQPSLWGLEQANRQEDPAHQSTTAMQATTSPVGALPAACRQELHEHLAAAITPAYSSTRLLELASFQLQVLVLGASSSLCLHSSKWQQGMDHRSLYSCSCAECDCGWSACLCPAPAEALPGTAQGGQPGGV